MKKFFNFARKKMRKTGSFLTTPKKLTPPEDFEVSKEHSNKKDMLTPAEDFDSEYYLKRYPDIAAANLDPYLHFITHGKTEGRRHSPFKIQENTAPLNHAKETILIVSHEASRTGAPILALNIAQTLKDQLNIVVLLLGDGSITSFFKEACHAILSIDQAILHDPVFAKTDFFDRRIRRIIQQYDIKCAIVNSSGSSSVLATLANCFVPSVLLVHEFRIYMYPPNRFANAFLWAGNVVFPAKIIQENAVGPDTAHAIHLTHILPQGKSIVPIDPLDNKKGSGKTRIKMDDNHLSTAKPFLILGAGSVQYRKGIDLFIATAAELKRLHPEYNIKMLWVGADYDPKNDLRYSCFLAEQIKRSALADSFTLIDEISDLDELYKEIDLFYLSSRLDPLPNVAIDVMTLGKPLICFDKATGIAEILAQDSDTAACIIPHLSITEATKKIIKFYQSSDYCFLISSKMKTLAQRYFNMQHYVTSLLALLENQKKQVQQEKLDCITLNDSSDFKENFFSESDVNREIAIRKYVRSWHTKAGFLRKPTPGFNQSVYDAYHHCHERQTEPFAAYLRAGKPEGPWKEKVITPSSHPHIAHKKWRQAIHIHAPHPDGLDNILTSMQLNKSAFDLYITTNDIMFNEASHVVAKHKSINCKLHAIASNNRNLHPLSGAFDSELQKYDVVGHFCTNSDLDNSQLFPQNQFLFIIENLLGGQNLMADHIIQAFQQSPKLGLVFADDPYLHFNFPVGGMCWIRPKAIEPLFQYQHSSEDIERFIPIAVSNQGFSKAVTYVPGYTWWYTD